MEIVTATPSPFVPSLVDELSWHDGEVDLWKVSFRLEKRSQGGEKNWNTNLGTSMTETGCSIHSLSFQ